MRIQRFPGFLALWAVTTCVLGATEEPTRLLRFADIHEEQVTFVYAGDIWLGSTAGGVAQRLTTHPGMELFPKFSPDGRWIAFSAEYSGTRQVHVISVDGGAPRQLTYYNDVGSMPPRGGFDYQVLDWTPDGQSILFRANRLPWDVRMGRPYLVSFAGGMERPLPVPESGGGMFSPDGRKLVYTPISREFRTWKRYRGGRAQDVWTFDLVDGTAEPLTDFDGTDNQPLWIGDTIYFTSDRAQGRLNLFAIDPRSKVTRQVTHHADFDVLWPSAGPRQLVYECGGYLYRMDPQRDAEPVRIPLRVTGDFVHRLPRTIDVSDNLEWADISTTGKRALIVARGDLFTVPAEKGEIRNLTRTPGVREMAPAWSPDGRRLAYISDRTGEYELYLRDANGGAEERRLTNDGDVWRFAPVWSPDGNRLLFADRKRRLNVLQIDSGKVTEIDRGEVTDISSYGWSPDSRWIVYDKVEPSQLSSIFVYDLENGTGHRLTDAATNDYEPVFDPQGRYLYFLSDRDFNLTFSDFEFNYLYTNPTRIYAATLSSDGPALFRPRSDDETPAEEKSAEEPGKKRGGKNEKKDKDADGGTDGAKKTPVAVRIDAEGFGDRVVALPGAPGEYSALRATDDGVLFLDDSTLKLFSVEDEKVSDVIEEIEDYALSGDGSKLLYLQHGGSTLGIVEAKPDQKAGSGLLDLADLHVRVVPPDEWRQIFEDGWRITRDWFYDPAMHGVDWAAMRELYRPLVDHVAHRADLDYILGEMGGELAAGHYYVNWGDLPEIERRENGLLGAEIEAHESGYFRVARILAGENWNDELRSPLTEAGVKVAAGDFILAVDGRPTTEVSNFYALLENRGGHVVTLTVNDRPDPQGAREERVRTITRETGLRYLDWVTSRREMVERLSGGRIGYVHLPDTAVEGNRELQKHFYPQARKEALIFDVRYNGGGFIPDRMMELISRPRLSFWARRDVEPMRTPGFAHVGPKACLINGYSSSGGDAFPYYFRKLGLGPLIGTRTWGGLIGLSGNPSFVDGGSVAVPQFRFFDEGRWEVENEGVAPDIEVLDRPDAVARGEDPTLTRAVEVLLAQLAAAEPPVVSAPPPRVQSR